MSRRLLSLILAAAALCAAAGPARADQPVSSHAMVHTCCTAPAMKERIFAEAGAAEAEFIRVDVELGGIFANDGAHPEWSALDGVIELAERHDIKVLGVILGIPSWLSSCPERGAEAPLCPPRDAAEFGRLAAEVAAHARDSIRHWEILNEPDADWAFKGTAEDYARVLSAAYDAIHARVRENWDNETNELMNGAPGTMIAARVMLDRTGEERWGEAWRESAEELWRRRYLDGFWTYPPYGKGIGASHGIGTNTNVLLAGRTVVVCGYGMCGRGVASRAHGLGARVIVCEVDPAGRWYEVVDPARVRRRVELVTSKPTYLLIQARRVRQVPVLSDAPQQSDYTALWQASGAETASRPDVAGRPLTTRVLRGITRRLKRAYRTVEPAWLVARRTRPDRELFTEVSWMPAPDTGK
jgi:hypothetical protein